MTTITIKSFFWNGFLAYPLEDIVPGPTGAQEHINNSGPILLAAILPTSITLDPADIVKCLMEEEDIEKRARVIINSLARTFAMLKPSMIDSVEHGMPVSSADACHFQSSFEGC